MFTFDSSITESWSFSISKFAVGDFFLKTLFSFYKTLLECESTLVELCPNLQPYVLTYNHLANEYTPGEHLDAGYQIKGC